MNYLLDTNILMNYPEILEKTNEIKYYVSHWTIVELDKKKNSRDGDAAYKARRASHYLLNKYDNWELVKPDVIKETTDDFDYNIMMAAKRKDLTLLTGDILLCLRAKMQDVKYVLYNKNANEYNGIQYYEVVLDENNYNEELADMINNGTIPEGVELAENEFFIVTDDEDNTMVIFQHKNGKLNIVKNKSIKNRYIDSIWPRNREQSCLFSLLDNKKISIISANGAFGSGKSFITLNYALQELQGGRINKIVFVPNNSYVANAREHGFEPGTPIEKELAFLGTIIDIMGEHYVLDAIQRGEIEVVPMAVMRGRNFDNAIILVNEAQNLDEDHIKLLIGRVGENSRIIFDGDQKQTDSSLFKNKNGLKLLSRLSENPKFAKIFGKVKLVKVERSFTAQAADYLDNL